MAFFCLNKTRFKIFSQNEIAFHKYETEMSVDA
jgi:hypothetical protein